MTDVPKLKDRIPPSPKLLSPGMLSQSYAQDNSRASLDRNNELLLLEGVKVDTVFIGDSLTVTWGVQETLTDCLGLIVNRAVGGDAARHIAARIEADVLQLKPRNVFVLVGTNDIAHRFGYDDDDTIFAKMVAGYRACFEALGQAGVRTYVGTIPPVCPIFPEERREVFREMFRRKCGLIPRVNEAIREMAAEFGLVLVDYHAALADANGELPKELAADTVHLSARGQYVMNQLIRQVLAEHPPAK